MCVGCPTKCLVCSINTYCTKCTPGYDREYDAEGNQICVFYWWKWFLIVFGTLLGVVLVGKSGNMQVFCSGGCAISWRRKMEAGRCSTKWREKWKPLKATSRDEPSATFILFISSSIIENYHLFLIVSLMTILYIYANELSVEIIVQVIDNFMTREFWINFKFNY